MIPLLPFYAEKLGASPTEVGLLIGVYAACQLVSGPLLGRLSDFTGRKPLLLVSQAGTFAGFLILAFAPSLWVVFLARVIDGSTAGNLSLAQAYISDVTKPEDRAKSFGVIGIAFGMGFLIGPAISGFLAKFDYRDPIFAAAGLSATSILATYFLLPKATAGKGAAEGPGGRRLSLLQWSEYGRYFRQPRLALRLWQFLSFAVSFALFTSGFALFAERRLTWHGMPFGPEQVGYTWAYAGFMGIFLQGPALGRLVKRFGESNLNRVGICRLYSRICDACVLPLDPHADRCDHDLCAGKPGASNAHQSHHPGCSARRTRSGAGADSIPHVDRSDRRAATRRISDPTRNPDWLGPCSGSRGCSWSGAVLQMEPTTAS